MAVVGFLGLLMYSILPHTFVYWLIATVVAGLSMGFFDKPDAETVALEKERKRLEKGLAEAQAEYDALLAEQRFRDYRREMAAQRNLERRQTRIRNKNKGNKDEIWSNR